MNIPALFLATDKLSLFFEKMRCIFCGKFWSVLPILVFPLTTPFPVQLPKQLAVMYKLVKETIGILYHKVSNNIHKVYKNAAAEILPLDIDNTFIIQYHHEFIKNHQHDGKNPKKGEADYFTKSKAHK